MKTVKIVLMSCCLTTAVLVGLTAANPPTRFVATLTGKQAVPAVDTKAGGEVLFTLSQDGKSLQYKMTVRDIADVTMAHLHMAPKGKNGAIVAWLYPAAPPPKPKAGLFSGTLAEGTLTAAQLTGPLSGKPLNALVEKIKSGEIYVNVHTDRHPGGEIRGQVH
jgi:hypothetical protein